MCLFMCRAIARNDTSQRAKKRFAIAMTAPGWRYAGTWLFALLLLVITGRDGWSAATVQNGSEPSAKRSTEYMNTHQFLRSRVSKLRAIIERSQNAQRRLRSQSTPEAQQAYAKWQNIEKHARKMLVDIQNSLKALAARKRPNPLGPLAKNVMLTRLDGRREKIANHRGDVMLLHFWANWCRPCVKEMGSLQQLYEDFRDRGFSVVPVSLEGV